ncbi:Retrotransposon gag domain [Lasallia pustulata]|uniref:Retrotransposon gag domain n=1 Tax=Lasallia pustulata TaxID=136370 RepID=A0A1W5D342_9LECA|nr:Retrotransposon gag domain [Lasallia pustulata]
MHLRGPAFAWFEPTLTDWLESETKETDTIATFGSFAHFEVRLQQVFGSALDEERTAARLIRQLKQKASTAQYYAEFQQLASKLDWNDNALGSAFYEGLKDIVKDNMEDPPDTYQALRGWMAWPKQWPWNLSPRSNGLESHEPGTSFKGKQSVPRSWTQAIDG